MESASATAERRAQHLAVLDALATLSPGDRELMLLAVWDDLRAREIAVVLDIAPVVARARLSRARRRLERALRVALAGSEITVNPLMQRTAT